MTWKTIESCPQDGIFLVHEAGAMRVMFREGGEWKSTSVGLNEYGDASEHIRVRETGVYEPTHWMELPERPPEDPWLKKLAADTARDIAASEYWYKP